METNSVHNVPGQGNSLIRSDLTLRGRREGKVRDVYDLPPDTRGGRVLVVASDRISAFDVVMPTPIPGKGRLLTSIAAFWLRWIEREGLAATHLISTDAGDVPQSGLGGSTQRSDLAGRVTIGRSCRVLPVEFVVRGYLEGSGWRDYEASGSVCGHRLPAGLRRCEKLPRPLFTPATKAEQGEHDENIGFDDAVRLIDNVAGEGAAERLRDASLAMYERATAYALQRGIILADTKFEFGIPETVPGERAEPIVIDEALTPDSSRFWPADRYEPGHTQPSFDKQYVREYLEGLVASGAWDKAAPGPALPAEVVDGTLARYREASAMLTGG
ncbi:MAG: phosphoribosylaminoimidazolesuccinocarboxamide synthase [Planctomycetota bacterium]